MADRRVVFISSITAGSKFRLVANRDAAVRKAKAKGTQWSSCALNDTGGNFSRPFHSDKFTSEQGYTFYTAFINEIEFDFMRTYPPSFSVFNLPCPKRFNYHFPVGDQIAGKGYSFIKSLVHYAPGVKKP
jgi:hypothetical protein